MLQYELYWLMMVDQHEWSMMMSNDSLVFVVGKWTCLYENRNKNTAVGRYSVPQVRIPQMTKLIRWAGCSSIHVGDGNDKARQTMLYGDGYIHH